MNRISNGDIKDYFRYQEFLSAEPQTRKEKDIERIIQITEKEDDSEKE